MKIRKNIFTLILCLCLVGCSNNVANTEETTSQSNPEDTEISDTSNETSITDDTEVVEITESSEITETTEHNPIHVMEEYKIIDPLPDGEYFAGILEFDEDNTGATFVINGYYALPEEEVDNFEDGDTIKWADQERTIEEITTDSGYTFLTFDGFYFLQNQNNGYYYLRGDCDEIPFYRIADQYHLAFDTNIIIYDRVQILDLSSILKTSSYSIDDVLDGAYQYDSIEHLRSDMEIVREQNPHYIAGEEYWVGIHIIVENGCVKRMYLNPAQHQDWIPYDLYYELRPVEE